MHESEVSIESKVSWVNVAYRKNGGMVGYCDDAKMIRKFWSKGSKKYKKTLRDHRK